MRYRIALWAIVGFLVACGWALYIAGATKGYGMEPIVSTLLHVTCPIALYSNHPIGLYAVLVANTATYALAGLFVEAFWRQPKHSHT
jgi:hypothetical protein